MASDFPPMTPFALAFAAEYKGFMRAHDIKGAQIADLLDRGEGYVSERVNGKRALDINDVDALATLAGNRCGIDLLMELTRRAETALKPGGEVIQGRFGQGDVGALAQDEHTDEPTVKQPPTRRRTAARKGTRKADQAPHAE